MDWFSWLSKTGLKPSLVYQYGLAFVDNELEEKDIDYFSHDFLQSMGITIAKHRLEILKLASKDRGTGRQRFLVNLMPSPVGRLIRWTRKNMGSFIQTWVHRKDSDRALVAVMSQSTTKPSLGWREAMARRSKRLVKVTKKRLMITTGGPRGPSADGFSTRKAHALQHKQDKAGVKWDAMFQDLKPT